MDRHLPDFQPRSFPDLSWKDEDRAETCEDLFLYATTAAEEALSWYGRKRGAKRRLGRVLRVGALIAVTAAALLPVLAQALAEDGVPAFNPAWATVSLVVAAFFVGLDRFSGATRGWIRYLHAFQELACELEAFRLDYEQRRLEWDEEMPTWDQVRAHVSRCRQFLMRVHEVVRRETEQWAGDFETVLRQLDRPGAGRS